jgi:hypothetical protein
MYVAVHGAAPVWASADAMCIEPTYVVSPAASSWRMNPSAMRQTCSIMTGVPSGAEARTERVPAFAVEWHTRRFEHFPACACRVASPESRSIRSSLLP